MGEFWSGGFNKCLEKLVPAVGRSSPVTLLNKGWRQQGSWDGEEVVGMGSPVPHQGALESGQDRILSPLPGQSSRREEWPLPHL